DARPPASIVAPEFIDRCPRIFCSILWCGCCRFGENSARFLPVAVLRAEGIAGLRRHRFCRRSARKRIRSRMETIGIVLFMLGAVVLSGIIVRTLPLGVPTPLVQIGLGAVIAAFSSFEVRLDPEIFFLLFLPPLLFLDGWRIPKEGLLRDKGMILELSLGLVFLAVVGMGHFIHWMIPAMPLPVAFALAAIVSPTDPVAVSAITSRVPMPKRVMHVLEGESLLNDASGLVCFRFAVAAALTGAFSLSGAAVTFAQLAVV